MTKDTSKIVEELHLNEDFNTFYNENKEYITEKPLSELLDELIKEKNLHKSDIIKNSGLSEVYSYQIFSGLRLPDRKKLLALAIGMGLNFDETQTLLKSAGYPPLYIKLPFDSVVIYGFFKNLSIPEINELLFNYGFKTLG
ncbi:MAG: helix-turn-helix transcriptional regulator [Ruminococcaceae bacterium]|nr:helix-turn-helix transcriptional regulator [Oscillospiraceae bacterium]